MKAEKELAMLKEIGLAGEYAAVSILKWAQPGKSLSRFSKEAVHFKR